MNGSLYLFLLNHQAWIIGIISVIIGWLLATASNVVWDKYKRKNIYKSLLENVLFELKENRKRMDETFKKLPEDIRLEFEKNKKGEVFIRDEQISKLGWRFPKPYLDEAWKTFILSGFAVDLPSDTLEETHKIYNLVNSINFLSNLSLNIFQIIAQQNRLDEETNKNFDRFCKIGTCSIEAMGLKDISSLIKKVGKLIRK